MVTERRQDISRLEGFSDVACAGAMTLLVVPLDVPRNYEPIRTFKGMPSCATVRSRPAVHR